MAFIALEGGEGSGKDTMIDRLKAQYAGRDDIIFTREPGGTQIGEQIRAVLLDPKNKGMDVRAELMLFLAARMQLMKEVITPALAQGKSVISNRFGLSTEAYQIYGRERQEYKDFLRELTQRFFPIQPYYILLDVTPEVGLKRVEERNDGKTRFDAESLAFHHRVLEGYRGALLISHASGISIDANQSLEDVWEQVKHTVASFLGY